MSNLQRQNASSPSELENVTKPSSWNPMYKTGHKRWLIITFCCSLLLFAIFIILLLTKSSEIATIIFAVLGFVTLIFGIFGLFFIPDEVI